MTSPDESQSPPPVLRGGGPCVSSAFRLGGRRAAVVDLTGGTAGAEAVAAALGRAVAEDPGLEAAARLGGAALGLVPFVAAARGAVGVPGPALCLSVGDAVRRGVPTAARVTLTGRAPQRPGVTEAQCGGTFAFGLARHLDLLVVVGRSEGGAHLEVGPGGEVLAHPVPWPGPAAPLEERRAALHAGAPGASILLVGPAAEAGLPFANVASVGPDGPPSFVGRGGLGARLGGAGVLALTVATPDGMDASPDDGADGLRAALRSSPRLLERGRGGTLELAPLRGAADPGRGEGAVKHGCRGCPTPCGWVLRTGGPARRGTGGRFAALQGFLGGADPAACLARCNGAGMDARAAAAVVHAEGRAGELPAVLDELLDPASPLHRAALDPRSAAAEPGPTAHPADLAARVGALASPRGPEPLRSLSVAGLGSAAAELPGLELAGDPDHDAGVLAHWHGAFAAAVDVSGFCAFSAAGLVADGLMGVDELAARLAPRAAAEEDGSWGEGPAGLAMLAAGVRHVALHRELGGGPGPAAGAALAPELARALDGFRAAEARDPFRPGASGAAARPPAVARPPEAGSPAGSATVLVRGLLAARLGAPAGADSWTMELPVPEGGAALTELLEGLAAGRPAVRTLLLSARGRALPAAVVDGARLLPRERIRAGQRVELLLAVPGG